MKPPATSTPATAHVNKGDCIALTVRAAAAEAGGMTALARKLSLNRTTIYNWSRAGKVPVQFVPYVEQVTKLPRWFLRPDIYDWPRGAAVVTKIGTFKLCEQDL